MQLEERADDQDVTGPERVGTPAGLRSSLPGQKLEKLCRSVDDT